MKNTLFPIILIILIIIVIIISAWFLSNEGNSIIFLWLNWKLNHPANDQQKEVSSYFKKVGVILELAQKTQLSNKDSYWGYADANEAIGIVVNTLRDVHDSKVPRICNYYHELIIGTLEHIKDYHANRLLLAEHKITEETARNNQLQQFQLAEKQQKEYFRILREIGMLVK